MINDYEVKGLKITHSQIAVFDGDMERENQAEFDKINEVSKSKPKKTKKPKGPKSPKVKADWNIGSKGCLMPEVHNLRDIQNPYSSPHPFFKKVSKLRKRS
jgi:hypothetical protein